MKYEDKVRVARERVFQAEEAMDAYIHGKEYDSERFARLSDDVTTARNELLDQLSALFPLDRTAK